MDGARPTVTAGAVPPPRCTPEEAQPLRTALQQLADEQASLFKALFLAERPVRVPTPWRSAFARYRDAGLTRAHGAKVAAAVRVVPFFGRFIATDLADHEQTDQVFPLMFEQVYLVRNLGVREGDRVLELCVGSGANALAAGDVASHVVGVDLSPRALAFAAFNQLLNEPARVLDLREGDLFGAIREDERFDLVFVNPPFEAVPPDTEWFLHSHGGPDGLDVVREILNGLPHALADGGRFEIVTWAPGGEDSSLLEALIRETLPTHDLLIHYFNGRPMRDACMALAQAANFEAWQADLHERGLTHMHFLFVSATPADGTPSIREVHPAAEIERCDELARTLLGRSYRT